VKAIESDVSRSYVVLRLGKRRFALPAEIVEELAPALRLHRFPHRSPSIAGVIVRRGRIVPVLDAAPLLAGRTSSAQHFYLIARCRISQATDLCAMPVDAECELATGDLESPVDQPPYVAGKLQTREESLDVLNLDSLLAFSAALSLQSSGVGSQP
jgi:chemotaxis signal transduction protein